MTSRSYDVDTISLKSVADAHKTWSHAKKKIRNQFRKNARQVKIISNKIRDLGPTQKIYQEKSLILRRSSYKVMKFPLTIKRR